MIACITGNLYYTIWPFIIAVLVRKLSRIKQTESQFIHGDLNSYVYGLGLVIDIASLEFKKLSVICDL